MRLFPRAIGAALLSLALMAGGSAISAEMKDWSPDPATNNAAPPYGWPSVTMRPNEVAPTAREMMGTLKRWYQRARVFDPTEFSDNPTGIANGTVDATAAIQAAQAACVAAKGGEIQISGYRLYHVSSITVAASCPIVGSYTPHAKLPVTDYTTITSALIHGPAATINMDRGSSMRNVAVLAKTLPAVPTTYALGSAFVKTMAAAGTGITITGPSAKLEDVQVLGFTTSISATGQHQLRFTRVFMDGQNGLVMKGSHDMSVFDHVEMWPFLTASQSWTSYVGNITGVVANGSGFYTVTADTSNFVDGDTVFITGVVGITGINTRCVVDVIDASHFDCTNISSAPTATAQLTAGNNVIKLSMPNPSVSNGQVVSSGSGFIQDNTTVTWADPNSGYAWISIPPTGSGDAVSLSFANGTYVSGGTVRLENNFRAGTGFYLEDNVLLNCSSCFAYGYNRGFDLNGELSDNFTASAADFPSALQDPLSVGIYVRGPGRSTSWVGGYTHGTGTPLIHDTTNESTNNFSIPWIYQGPAPTATIVLLRGSIQLSNSYIFNSHTFLAPIFVADTVNQVRFNGDDFSKARGFWNFAATEFMESNGSIYSNVSFLPKIIQSSIYTGTTKTSVSGGSEVWAVDGQEVSAAIARRPVSGYGSFRNLIVENTSPPGDGETQTVTIERNGDDTVLTCTISGQSRTCGTTGTGRERNFTNGDTWVARINTSSGAAPSIIKFGAEWVPSIISIGSSSVISESGCLLVSGNTSDCLLVSGSTTNALLVR